MPIRKSSISGIPKGVTASRPSSPSTGEVYYNGTSGILEIYNGSSWVPCSAPPGQPTISVADVGTGVAYGSAQASITFTPNPIGGQATGYTATASSGGYSATSTSNPVIVTVGNNGSYTFSGTIYNGFGTSVSSTSSTATLTTVPQAPTIGTISGSGASGQLSVPFTAGQTGGSTITNYKYSLDGTNYTAFSPAQTTSPLTISGLTNGTSYSVRIKAVNVNGDSAASSASNSASPFFALGFLSSTTHTIAQTGTYIIKAVGGGGSSGGASNQANGGGSGYYATTTVSLNAGDVLTINIGAGGATPQNNGGNTTVVKGGTTLLTANGGSYGAGSGNLGNGGSGGGATADGGGNGGGIGGYNGSNGANATSGGRLGGTGALGVSYGNGNNANYPPGGSGSYAGGPNTWAGINGFGAGSQAATNAVAGAAGGGGGGATWNAPAKAGTSGLVVITL